MPDRRLALVGRTKGDIHGRYQNRLGSRLLSAVPFGVFGIYRFSSRRTVNLLLGLIRFLGIGLLIFLVRTALKSLAFVLAASPGSRPSG